MLGEFLSSKLQAPPSASQSPSWLACGAFTAIFLLFNECYPTRLRSAALGSGMMFGKLGAAAASPLTVALPLSGSLGISGGLLTVAAASAATLRAFKGKAEPEGAEGAPGGR